MPRKASHKKEKPQQFDRYFIDPEWYKERGRAFEVMVNAPRCLSCQRDVANGEDTRDPVVAIGECCSLKEGFIRPEMPLLEAIFRVILAGGNEPKSAVELRDALVDKGFDPVARDMSQETLERMLEKDSYYGFRKLEPSSGELKAA